MFHFWVAFWGGGLLSLLLLIEEEEEEDKEEDVRRRKRKRKRRDGMTTRTRATRKSSSARISSPSSSPSLRRRKTTRRNDYDDYDENKDDDDDDDGAWWWWWWSSQKKWKKKFFSRHDNVYVYVPNVIGYARLLLVLASFYYANEENRPHGWGASVTVFAYVLSFICDELDGRCARRFNQCTEFGAVLDMVTDRLATTGLLIILSNMYRDAQFACILLIFLDISSHWLQMHSQLAIGKKGHKDMHESRFRLLRLYYTNRIFMGVCCVSTEVLYLCLFMARDRELSAVRGLLPNSSGVIETFSHVQAFDEFLVQTVGIGSLHTFATQFAVLAIPGFLLKQTANIAQLRSAVVAMCNHEPEFALKREKK